MAIPTVQASYIFHRNEQRIRLHFENFGPLNKLIKSIPQARWSKTYKSWHIPCDTTLYANFKSNLPGGCVLMEMKERVKAMAGQTKKLPQPVVETVIVKSNLATGKAVAANKIFPAPLHPANLKALKQYLECLQLKAYSTSTIKTYKNEFFALLQLLKSKEVSTLTADDVKRYMLYCINTLHLSENSLHSRINALKFYFEQVLHKEKIFFDIPRPKKPLLLPKIFNQDEITSIIKAASNLKHRVMLMLAYSAGLRVSEVVSIKTHNIDSKRMCILIENAKGKKDRLVALSPVLLIMLREYWNAFKPLPKGFLFSGQTPGEAYNTRSLQLVLNSAKQKAGILKPGSIHALRHSFATHLLDKGTDVTMIMKLLGHNDIKTTLRYLHVTNRDMLHVISPLDNLKLD